MTVADVPLSIFFIFDEIQLSSRESCKHLCPYIQYLILFVKQFHKKSFIG